jgi:hypothetical protein
LFPLGFNWDTIKNKVGDDIVITLIPSERSALISLILNLKAIADMGGFPDATIDKDEFDAFTDGLINKLIIQA